MRTQQQLEQHKEAARRLEAIFEKTYTFLSENSDTTELETQNFIIQELQDSGMTMDADKPIVAFRENTGLIHYFPHEQQETKKLTDNSLVLLDIRARLDKEATPYADITHMAYKGEAIFPEQEAVVQAVFDVRDKVVQYLAGELSTARLPTGVELQQKTLDCLAELGYEGRMQHSVGHSIGFSSPHGQLPHLSLKNPEPLLPNIAYTIEPGIYFSDHYGARSEINFFIDENLQLHLTTEVQKGLRRL